MSNIASRRVILMLAYFEFSLVLSRIFVAFETGGIVGCFAVRKAGIG